MIFEKLRYYFFEFLPNNLIHILFEFISGFIPIIFAIIYFNIAQKKNKILIIYAILIFLFEIINNFYSAFSLNNHDIYLFSYIVESIILVIYFNKEIGDRLYAIVSQLLIFMVIIFLIINIFSEIDLMNDISSSFQSLILIFLTLINYYHILSKLNIDRLTRSTFFWVNTGTFLYFSGKFFVSLFLLEILGENPTIDLLNYWSIVSVLLVIQRVFISIGISKISK